MDWQLLVATLINGVGVMAVVQAIKVYLLPVLKAQYPWLLPLIATAIGPAIAWLTEWLTALLGYEVDLTAIVAALTGLAASGAFAVVKELDNKARGK